MCGIVGVVLKQADSDGEIGKTLLEGLKKLEYRGYDSCGFAVTGRDYEGEPELNVRKDVGKVAQVGARLEIDSMKGFAGICHTRWATHGGVTKTNAHPHTDCKGKIAVVHNGIVENYQELRAALVAKGHLLISQTDTEVIPHLIEENYNGDLVEAVRASVGMLQGSYAVLAIVSGKQEIVAARKDSPLLLGVGADNMLFAASDAMPFITATKKAVFLDDGQMARLGPSGYQVFSVETGKQLEKPVNVLNWDAQDAVKSGFEHFMLKEIMEEPLSAKSALMQPEPAVNEFAKEIKAAKRVVFTACGTALHASMVIAAAFDSIAGLECDVQLSSEYAYKADREGPGTLLIAVSQSGETADVLECLKKAKAKGAKIGAIVNVQGSTIDRLSDYRLYLNCGPEIGVASTKAFVCQVIAGYVLAYAVAGKQAEGKALLSKLPGLIKQTIESNDEAVRSISKYLASRQHAYCIARRSNFPIALEGALKIKEVSYVHTEGMAAGELKHGTIALIEQGTPVIAINPADSTFAETLSNAMETKARGARIIGVANSGNQIYDDLLKIPVADPVLYPILCVLPLQMLAYYTATEKGLDPDQPRNLAKAVTVR